MLVSRLRVSYTNVDCTPFGYVTVTRLFAGSYVYVVVFCPADSLLSTTVFSRFTSSYVYPTEVPFTFDDTIEIRFPTVSYPYVSIPCGVCFVFSRSMLSYV